MSRAKITVAGIGPGNEADITGAVINALREADVVVGYKYYFQFVKPYLKEQAQCVDTGMKKERDRARQAWCARGHQAGVRYRGFVPVPDSAESADAGDSRRDQA